MSVSVTKTDVTNVAAELSTETTERVDLFIGFAREFICEEKWGTKAKLAITLYTAHLLTLANRGATGAVGAVTGEKVGELSRNYGSTVGGENDELAQTPYGLIIKQMRRSLIITPMVV